MYYIYPLTLCQKTFLLSQNLEIDMKNVRVHQRFFFFFASLCP
jgi:hypothetical protein